MRTLHSLSPDKDYVLSLYAGDAVQESITAFCKEQRIVSASYTAIGAVTNVIMAVYDVPSKTYTKKSFYEAYELVSLVGNISTIGNEAEGDGLFAHSHASISGEDFVCYGGHLMEAEVYAVVEVFFKTYTQGLVRKKDAYTGLNILSQG